MERDKIRSSETLYSFNRSLSNNDNDNNNNINNTNNNNNHIEEGS